RRRCLSTRTSGFFYFLPNLLLDLSLMVVIVRHRCVCLGRQQIGVVPAHLIHRPTMGEVVHDNLSDPHAGLAPQVGRLSVLLLEMWVCYLCGHGRSSLLTDDQFALHHTDAEYVKTIRP